MIRPREFSGRRILVVEDDGLIAMLLEAMLGDLGCKVVGPAVSVDEALEMIGTGVALDAALLDLNLDGSPSYPVADALTKLGVPVVFCTGYGDAMLRPSDRSAPLLRKPYRSVDLARALGEVFAPAQTGGA